MHVLIVKKRNSFFPAKKKKKLSKMKILICQKSSGADDVMVKLNKKFLY